MSEQPHPTRRLALGLGLAAPMLARPALAQGPRGLTRILVGFPAGGSADTVARLLAERLRPGYASNVLVENRPGASGRLAADALKAAEPDGTTLMLVASSILTLVPHIYPASTNFNTLTDFIPVCPAGEFPFGMAVGPKAGMPDKLRDFENWAKTQPEIAYGSAAAGSALHFLGIQYAKASGLPMVHVPYRGSSPALQDLIGGVIGASFHPMVDLAGHAEGGRIKLTAVSTEARMANFPTVPTFAEQGYPQLTGSEWFGIFLPARTPAPIVAALNEAIVQASAIPEYRAALARLIMVPKPMAPGAFAALLRQDWDHWIPIVRDSGFRPED